MSLTDELERLANLRASGALSEQEFQQAKRKLLDQPAQSSKQQHHPREDSENQVRRREFRDERDSLGKAANRYVSLQTVVLIIGVLLFLFFFAPKACRMRGPFSIVPTMSF